VKKKILFIINPKSGVKSRHDLPTLIGKTINQELFDSEVALTAYPGHAMELTARAVRDDFDAVVVAGGDGSVNEVASVLINTRLFLGIIPNGSGNGLARSLEIPLNLRESLKMINRYNSRVIDTFEINGLFGCNLAGVGFDALVAHQFAGARKRGFLSYLTIILKQYYGYKPQTYRLKNDDISIQTRALLISVANSNQFGSGAVIAPQASPDDGIIDVCILKKIPLMLSPFLGMALLGRWIDKTSFIQYIRTQQITIEADHDMLLHIDGDPVSCPGSLNISVNPLSLKVIC
jgi:diacylglycerol kinase (ATP)